MAKNGKKKQQGKGRKQKQKQQPTRTNRVVSRLASNLDAGALAFRQLLLDPCNAKFAGPPYSGLGSGNFVRRRAIIAAEGLSVEGTYVFQLGTGIYLKGSHVAATQGTPYTLSALQIFAGANADNEHRCIAGCVKIRYIGSEGNRAGLISTLAAPAAMFQSGSQTTAVGAAAMCPFTNRVGEVMHEVKFVPNEGDEKFAAFGSAATKDNSTIAITYRGVPAATLVFEITAVYEVESVAPDGGSGMVINSTLPPTGNTINQVLRSLGPVSNWAYTNVVVPTIKATATRMMATGLNTSSAASMGFAALTL